MSDSPSGIRSGAIPLVAGLLVGGLFAWLAIEGADLQEVREVLSTQLRVAPALAALLSYFAYFLLKSLRWHLILAPMVRIKPGTLFPYVMVGYLGNLAVPFQLGEAYRGYLLSRDWPINTVSALSGIFLEKMFDLFAVLSLALLALQLVSVDMPLFETVQRWFLWISLAGIVVFVLVLARPGQAVSLGRKLLGLLPPGRLFDWFRRMLKQAVQGLAVLSSGTRTIKVLVISLLSWLLMLATLYFSLLAVSMAGSLPMATIILFFTVVGLTLPTSPGFVGTIQIAFVTGAQLFSAGQEHALAASVFYNLVITVPPILVGILCVIVLQRRRSVLTR